MTTRRHLFGAATLRLVALIFVLQIMATGGVLLFAGSAISAQFDRDQRDFVGEVQHDLRAWQKSGGDAALAAEIKARLATLKGEKLLLLMIDANGHFIAGNLAAWPPVVARGARWQTIDLYRIGSDNIERFGVSATTLPGGSQLLTGRAMEADLRLKRVSERVLIVAFLLALPLALLVAAATIRLINRRIAGIATTASAVGEGNLARRVPLDGSGDSFDRLGQGVNTMLARTETLVSELRIVTDGLAHDLRAPIFRLTSTLERAMQETRDPVAVSAMARVSVEAGVLQAILATAMQISQAEAGIGRNRFVEVDVADMLADIVELYAPAAEAQGLVLDTKASHNIYRLHRELVSQALGNLIDNVMKYGDGATKIFLSATTIDGGLQLAVADNGIGIPVADREKALKRFGRLDPSRQAAGAGLGLSLVEAVARLHGGDIALDDNNPGLRVVMTLRAS